MKLTRQQLVHTAVHSAKYPIGVVLGAVASAIMGVGVFSPAGFIIVFSIAGVGYVFEIVSDVLYWHALNLRPRSGTMQNVELSLSSTCTNCGHDRGDHTVETRYEVRCMHCGCKFLE